MGKKDEFRFRAQRFLTGPFDATDLSTLFLFLRSNSFGRASVHDLGHMLGHADLRDLGASVARISAMRTVWAYHIARLGPPNYALDLNRAPPELFEVMDAALSLLDDAQVKTLTRQSRPQVGTTLAKLRRNFSHNSHGTLRWTGFPLKDKEIAVLTELTQWAVSKGPYDADTLFDDTIYLLKRHGFMDEGQERLAEAKKVHLTLFAIASMHGVTFSLPDGSIAEATAGWTFRPDQPPNLVVSANITTPYRDGEVTINLDLFNTALNANEWCHDYDPNMKHASFLVPMEVTSEPKLRCMA